MASSNDTVGCGLESLRLLKSADPPLFLSPSENLSQAARAASEYIFSSLKPFTPKSPFERLLVNGFDAEQIWQQIDLQSLPLISGLPRELKRFEANPEEISKLFGEAEMIETKEREKEELEIEADEFEEFVEGFHEEEENEEGSDGEDEEDEDEEEEEEEGHDDGGGIEDKFLKINELEEYLEEDEAREYGMKKKKKSDGKLSNRVEEVDKEDDEEGEEEQAEEDDEDDDGLGIFGADLDDEDDGARYEDFFGPKRKNDQKRKPKRMESHGFDYDDEQEDDKTFGNQIQNLSNHEKHQEKLRYKIEQMEKANLEPKTWTMQGEVTAARRPKNSALEVDLDFEHNVRPAPVVTEEVTASLEELIQKRIVEGNFDDVQKAPDLLSKVPKERKEMDENKSKLGLAEIYEEDYVHKTGLVSTALAFSDEQKKEASILFKKLCLKLDALSHFHFTPKPVIEDMSIQVNVPALAMEEIAPLAVSDAAMLAPEELFAGQGDIREETELTQAERKRRRADKKRKFKVASAKKTAMKKARNGALQNHVDGKAES